MLIKLLLLLSIFAITTQFNFYTKEMITKNQWPEENYHGYTQIRNDPQNQMFYWWFPSRSSRETDPLVLWLTGGPGCSSELALFVENGPFRVNEKTLGLEKNDYSWNSNANLLYIDQPLGTGFSSVNKKHPVMTEETVSKDIYEFLTQFIEIFPEFKGRDFYIFGESYAGHYVPHAANYVFNQRNKDLPLKGAAIGNGLLNPWVQNEAYVEYSMINRLITFDQYLDLLPKFRQCETMMQYNIKGGSEMCDA